LLLAGFVREVVSSIELGKSYGPYRLPQEVAAAPPTQTIPIPVLLQWLLTWLLH